MTKKKSLFGRLFGNNEADKSEPAPPPITIPKIEISRPDDGFAVPKWEVVRAENAPYDDVFMRTAMLNGLSADNLTHIVQTLALNPEKVTGGKGRQVMAIMKQVGDQGKWNDLLSLCQELNPDVSWLSEQE